MPDIHLLSNEISDLIAAGEVVERPSSVVKELVENSIDAGAKKITVEISGGGLKLIRVSDDGCGMNSENAEKCFQKHATSKIVNKEDLFSIKTLGFRGEALPSVAAVSKIRLITKESAGILGTEVINESGNIISVKETGAADGTVFEVKDLFFNTPARLKFMKSEQAEAGVINSLIEKIALSNPDISFKLISNGTVKIFTPGNGKITDTVYSVYGKDFASRLLTVDYNEGNVKIGGFTGKPLLNKPNRNFQIFFVNGRLIRSRVLQQSLEQSYRNAMLVGRYPCCIVYISIPYAEVDINVHPSKTEIKFSDDQYISTHLNKAIISALRNDRGIFEVSDKKIEEKQEVIPDTKPEKIIEPTVKEEDLTNINKSDVMERKVVSEEPVKSVKEDIIPQPKKEKITNFGSWQIIETVKDFPAEKLPILNDDSRDSADIGEVKTNISKLRDSEVLPVKKDIPEPVSEKKETGAESIQQEPEITLEKLPETTAEPIHEVEKESPKELNNMAGKTVSVQTEIGSGKETAFRIIGEAFKTYIIIEQDKELLLIDKHALHERMIFEHLKAESGVSSQILLTPIVCNLGVENNQIILSNSEGLRKLGFDISDIGTALMIREIPDIVNPDDMEYILSKAADQLSINKVLDESIFDELLYIVACKAAIKSGYHTTAAELESLIREYLENKEKLRYCPHGRPITVSFTETFIQKQFKRIV